MPDYSSLGYLAIGFLEVIRSCMLLASLPECASTMVILAAVSQKLIPQHLQKIKFVVQHLQYQ